VAILTPDLGTVLAWAYIGGDSADAVRGIGCNAAGEVWATGETNSPGLPFPSSAVSGSHSGNIDGFVVRFTANLSSIMNGMYISGNGVDMPLAISIGKDNEVAVCGQTLSTQGMPSGQGYSSQPYGLNDGFVLALPANGSFIKAFTYFGGLSNDAFTCITHDRNGFLVVGGWTASNDYKTWPEKTLVWVPPDENKGSEGYYEEVGNDAYDVEYNGGSTDGIVAKFNPVCDLVFSTFYGGQEGDVVNAVVCRANEDVNVIGTTNSSDLDLPDQSAQHYSGQTDGFYGLLSKDGVRLLTARYLGGSGADEGLGAAIGAGDKVYVCGTSTSGDLFPAGAGSTSNLMGGKDGLLMAMDELTVSFATLFGWTGDDMPSSIAIDGSGDIFMGGQTTSTLPTSIGKKSNPSVQDETTDGFATKYAFGTVSVNNPPTGTNLCGGQQVNISWRVQDMPNNETYSVEASGDKGMTWFTIVPQTTARNASWVVPMTAPDSASYMLRVRTARGHAALGGLYPASVAPEITAQPVATWICPGGSKTIRVTAEGDVQSYQWYKNDLPVPGATSSTYAITAATAGDAGSYHAVLTSACGTTTSETAQVTVAATPVITQQPQASVLINSGTTLTLTVAAEGPGLTYQWQHNSTNIPAPEGTEATLVIANVSAANDGTYRCLITSDCGSVTSGESMVSIITSVDEEGGSPLAGFSIAPQPASDNVTIAMIDGSMMTALTISDMHGRIVMHQSFTDASDATIPLSAISAGVYSITVQTTQGLRSQLIVVQR